MAAIDSLLKTMLEKGGSDLHLTIGLPPKARASGALQPIAPDPLDAAAMEKLLKEIVPERRWKEFLERKDLDLAHEIPGVARFRGNYLYNHWGQAAVFRQIPAKILSFDELKLPEARICCSSGRAMIFSSEKRRDCWLPGSPTRFRLGSTSL